MLRFIEYHLINLLTFFSQIICASVPLHTEKKPWIDDIFIHLSCYCEIGFTRRILGGKILFFFPSPAQVWLMTKLVV